MYMKNVDIYTMEHYLPKEKQTVNFTMEGTRKKLNLIRSQTLRALFYM